MTYLIVATTIATAISIILFTFTPSPDLAATVTVFTGGQKNQEGLYTSTCA
jgi:hypothetical protein